jgi:hypothetical protein
MDQDWSGGITDVIKHEFQSQINLFFQTLLAEGGGGGVLDFYNINCNISILIFKIKIYIVLSFPLF